MNGAKTAMMRLGLSCVAAFTLPACLLIDPPSESQGALSGTGAVGVIDGSEGGDGGEGSSPIVNGNAGAAGGDGGTAAGGANGGLPSTAGAGGTTFTPLGDPCTSNAECNNGLYCDGEEACNGGSECEAGALPCADTVPCTDDTCNESVDTCAFVPNHSLCTDAAAPTCDMVEGCILVPCATNADCDDGLFCNGGEMCSDGVCTGRPAPLTDDGIPCTVDSCTEAERVVHRRSDVTLSLTVSDRGLVRVAPSGSFCTADTCNITVSCLDEVTLSPTVEHDRGWGFGGWDGVDCEGVGACTFRPTEDTAVDTRWFEPNYVFISSESYPANLGGISGAADKCNALAQAAGLPGQYIPWLASETDFPRLHLGNARGWIHTDGKVFSDDIGFGQSFYPPLRDEWGNLVAQTELMWSATDNWGQPHIWGEDDRVSFTCDSWSNTTLTGGISGKPGVSNWAWGGGYGHCSGQQRIFCVGISFTVSVYPEPAPGRLAFIHDNWTPGGGLASADEACNADAEAAGVPGTFRAALATSTASAMSRFDLSGGPWVRLDGIPLAPTATEFFTNPRIGLVLNTNNDYSGYWVFTGMDNAPDQPGTLTCNDWTSNAAGMVTWMGKAADPEMAFRTAETSCQNPQSIYCLEE